MPLAKPSEKVAPPQKVIKALISHRSTNPQELSYQRGDFWYVTGERDGWYEALNPLTGSRGLVPKDHFEEFAKGGRQSGSIAGRPPSTGEPIRSQTPSQGHLSQISNPKSPPIALSMTSPKEAGKKGGYQPLYAIVQYDFEAERPDELDAKAGEPIVIIAQSNHEWFVAKPIGRLGGPGLIPVAFVQIRDTVTGKPIDKLPDSIPLVEEWKKATADYKAASIPLGRFDFDPSAQSGVTNSPYAQPNQSSTSVQQGESSRSQSSQGMVRSASQQSLTKPFVGGGSNGIAGSSSINNKPKSPIYKPEIDPYLPMGFLISLGVSSFHNESGNYWFRLQVTFLPDDLSSKGYNLTLYRTYEDFYDFQISLLDTFPYEAGRPASSGSMAGMEPERILPYMPGPVEEEVDEELTEYRREELDAYVKALIELGTERGRSDILRNELFRGFFAAKYGDYCEECKVRPELPNGLESMVDDGGMEELDERMAGMGMNGNGNGDHNGNGSSGQRSSFGVMDNNRRSGGGGDYVHPYAASSSSAIGAGMNQRSESSQGHSRQMSSSRLGDRSNSNHSRNNSAYGQIHPNSAPLPHNQQQQQSRTGSGSSRNNSPMPPLDSRPTSSGGGGYAQNAHIRQPSSSTGHGQYSQPHNFNQPYSANSVVAAPSTGGSSSFSQLPTPASQGGGGGGGQPPYVKIKIYDRSTDDLIAIRVHPNVSHRELYEKVRARLGNEVRSLRYRVGMNSGVNNSQGGGYKEISGDRELAEWIRGEDQKLVLYAEQ